MSYNWDLEYQDFWWVVRYHGFEPDDPNISKLLDHVFHAGYTQGRSDIEQDLLDKEYELGYEDARKTFEVDESEIEGRGYDLGLDVAKTYIYEVLGRGSLTIDQKLEILQEYADS